MCTGIDILLGCQRLDVIEVDYAQVGQRFDWFATKRVVDHKYLNVFTFSIFVLFLIIFHVVVSIDVDVPME